jgi:drug/metabolite transporter (DMT)-like permease
MEAEARWRTTGVAALLCLIWGTTWSVIQIGLEGIPPFTGVSLRFLLAGTLLVGLALARGIRLGRSRTERGLWLATGLLSFAGSYGVVYWAEQWIPSGLAAVLFAVYPLLVAILAHAVLPDERVRLREVLGVIVGFAGVAVIFSEDLTALGGAKVRVGAAVMLLSPLVSAVGSVAVKRWGGGISALSLASVPMLLGALVMAVPALALERDLPLTLDRRSVLALLYLAIAGSAVTFSLYFWLLERLPAKRVALIAYVIPVIAVALGVLRGEPLTPRILAGAACVVLGVFLAAR